MTTVEGRNDVGADCAAIQDAIAAGADQIKLSGTFNFGEQDDDRRTLFITGPVSIEGEDGATIHGGGVWRGDIQTHIGAFVVASAGPVVIKNVRFTNFRLAAIQALVCQGLEVMGCEFMDPLPGWSESFYNEAKTPLHSTSGILAFGGDCKGPLYVSDNHCDFLQTAEEVPQDEQFVACAMTNFSSIRITDNKINTRDDGVEVLFNGIAAQSPGEILIQDNDIAIEQRVGVGDYKTWPLHTGILCCRNGPGTATEIVDNHMTATGENMSAFVFSGDHFVIKNNEVALETGNPSFPTAAFWFGIDIKVDAFPEDLGPSLNDSDLSQNTVTGSAKYAIMTYDDNDSHGSVIKDNDFSAFTASEGVSPGFWEHNTDVDNRWS